MKIPIKSFSSPFLSLPSSLWPMKEFSCYNQHFTFLSDPNQIHQTELTKAGSGVGNLQGSSFLRVDRFSKEEKRTAESRQSSGQKPQHQQQLAEIRHDYKRVAVIADGKDQRWTEVWNWRPYYREEGWQKRLLPTGGTVRPSPPKGHRFKSGNTGVHQSTNLFICLHHLQWYLPLQDSTHKLWKGGRLPLSLSCPTQLSACEVIVLCPNFSNLVS